MCFGSEANLIPPDLFADTGPDLVLVGPIKTPYQKIKNAPQQKDEIRQADPLGQPQKQT
ncbi:hypothetical protein DENIT_20087 [Pseudomonas veronii]|nr:hypothetical protein DENIT_20087 [Pseudomonas veronii]